MLPHSICSTKDNGRFIRSASHLVDLFFDFLSFRISVPTSSHVGSIFDLGTIRAFASIEIVLCELQNSPFSILQTFDW